MILENLTKENFWNDLQERYPEKMKEFCDWIDEYKKENNWNSLFKPLPGYTGGAVGFKYPKYHDLPFAMQVGIFIQFVDERNLNRKYPFRQAAMETITEYFEN